ncbi:TIGR04283 family arsenosugar biosynthesis glycosyltransferase [Geobacter anodireducens]|nr:TIGR04283 family arsenosugar biosynthesis glycosyltransferase [Geobacter soli]
MMATIALPAGDMAFSNPEPELSVIVPTLNEAGTVGTLLAALAAQRDVALELLLCDGGSADGTVALVRGRAGDFPFPVTVTETAPGRGRQMNAGAAAARGATLLFLHADSILSDPLALRQGLDHLAAATRGDGRMAGHFRLRFAGDGPSPLAYRFYERKARLHRPGCTHGDQGLLIPREFFAQVGPFDEDLPIMEDVRLAERIAAAGTWVLLPAEIVTSARRFETEGLRERQTLNAILMNFAAIGWQEGVEELVAGYRSQDRSGRLRLGPHLARIAGLTMALTRRERLRLWYRTGGYVRGNAWQIPFFLDVRNALRRGGDNDATPLLSLHDRWFDLLTDNPAGRAAAALMVFLWFRLTLRREMRDCPGIRRIP